ncbi:MAG: ester cyclase [Janthinobacterium lividum]
MATHRDIVRRWLELWNGKAEILREIVSETIVTHAVLVGQVTEEPMTGRDALGGWIAQTHAAMPNLRFSIEVGPLVDGDLIALRWRVRGPHGAMRIDFTGTDILRIEDGRIVEYWVNSDTVLMLQQMEAASPAR